MNQIHELEGVTVPGAVLSLFGGTQGIENVNLDAMIARTGVSRATANQWCQLRDGKPLVNFPASLIEHSVAATGSTFILDVVNYRCAKVLGQVPVIPVGDVSLTDAVREVEDVLRMFLDRLLREDDGGVNNLTDAGLEDVLREVREAVYTLKQLNAQQKRTVRRDLTRTLAEFETQRR